ncbi:hypothetical protein BKP45_08415 [Anaerobacillus alkalidiazotrophicus]|uniref:Uncharacterized protein n=1 Tax=Anaerobacillus alkalidiazotrophicus TaxID=472963 RepID=A0A1S2M7T5_9BACI|nr:hypothetical protein [Anaerobacillus alkalidiazotrophicus]OIJ20808.1 hypothetical protein BKP45_08415 [Anaerobacillus alkalidiazotrophicus]
MAWYNLFLLSIPEAFILLTLVFMLLGISIKDKLKSILIFSFLYGGVAFTLTLFINITLKPFLTFIAFALFVAVIFRFKLINGFIISLIAFVLINIFEIAFILLYLQIFSITIEQILASPLLRTLISYAAVQIPMLLTTLLLLKFNLKIKMPLLR